MTKTGNKIRLFYSYSHKDETFREQLEEHLKILQRKGFVDSWTDRMILPGDEWKKAIDQNLNEADLILLLISSSFIASDYCFDKELSAAMARHEAGLARVIPIFLRPCDWHDAPFASLQGLPKDAVPISTWPNLDAGWLNVAAGIRSALEQIQEIKMRASSVSRVQSLQEAMVNDLDRLDNVYAKDSTSLSEGFSTGFPDLDRCVNGLQRGELFVIASRPAMGKTTLALHMAASVAETIPVLVFSTKLAAIDVSRRLTTTQGMVAYSRIGTGYAQAEDWPHLTAAIQKLNELNLFIDDSPTIALSYLRQTCIEEKSKSGTLALIVIDSAEYLALVDADNNQHSNIGKSLKILARDLDVPIVVTCNVPRTPELRPNKRPVLSDLENANGLAEEADVILFIYMDSHYNFESTDQGIAELIIAKNQFGPIGTVRLSHFEQYGAFRSFVGTSSYGSDDQSLPF